MPRLVARIRNSSNQGLSPENGHYPSTNSRTWGSGPCYHLTRLSLAGLQIDMFSVLRVTCQ